MLLQHLHFRHPWRSHSTDLQPTIDVDKHISGTLILTSDYLSRATAFV